MVLGISFDGLSQDSEVIFCGGFFGFLDMAGEFGDDDGGEDAEDGHDDHEFDQRKPANFQFSIFYFQFVSHLKIELLTLKITFRPITVCDFLLPNAYSRLTIFIDAIGAAGQLRIKNLE